MSTILDPDGGNDSPAIQQVLLFWLGLITIKGILGFFSSYLGGMTGVKMAARLRKRVYEHMQVLPIGYFQSHKPGAII